MKNLLYSILICSITFYSCQSSVSTEVDDEIEAIENGLLPAIKVKGDPVTTWQLNERMEYHKVPGLSVAVVREGKLRWAKGYGIANTENGRTVDTNTMFQAGSISKPIAALAALQLAERGILDLDTDVNTYLKGWKVPDSRFTADEKVTLRRLLTHTAGLTVHGFPGYKQTDSFPAIEAVLNGMGNTPAILVDTIPGTIWRYSGGGYTVMEKLVEEMTGMPLEDYMAQEFFQLLNMDNSTYEQPLPERLYHQASAAYDTQGEIIEGLWHNYPEQAAAGLWTTPADLAKYCIEIQKIAGGKQNGILSEETVNQMLTKHQNDWGLGPTLGGDRDSLTFGHGGKNAGFTNQMMAFAHRGDAVIMMTNADNGGRLMGEMMRSISSYYKLGISNPREVEIFDLPEENLEKLAGSYLLDEQVSGIGDYFIDVSVQGEKLLVNDPNNDETNLMSPLDSLRFIDLTKGDEVVFTLHEDGGVAFLWNNRFHFQKQ